MKLVSRLQDYCRQQRLISKADTIIVGVSGGKDSVTLLHCLCRLRREYGLNLAVAHVNHRLRSSAKADENFVRGLANTLNLPFYVEQSKQRARKGSIEELARKERFIFFSKLARKLKADAVALAHTRDDLAETVLMRLFRGGGTKGLAAIAPRRNILGANIIRPFLFACRKDIQKAAALGKFKFREDPTNRQKKFFRNRIRLELLPLLEKNYNNNIKEILAQTADSAAGDYDYLASQALKYLKKTCTSRSAGQTTLNIKKLKNCHIAMKRLILRLAIEELRGHTRAITFKHMREMLDLIEYRPAGSVVNLPRGLSLKKNPTNIKLYISKA